MKTIDLITDMEIRRAAERGHADHGWLNSFHTFSFADYYDRLYMGFRSLRVINEDRVAPGQGFGSHPHEDMEILSYVLEGQLAHKDSMGHASVIKAGEVQKITAGEGIMHSEFNGSDKEPVHFYQIWISPKKTGLKPSYHDAVLPLPNSAEPLFLIGAPPGAGGLVDLYQDAYVFRGVLDPQKFCSYLTQRGRGVWVQMLRGSMSVAGELLQAGDGACVEQEGALAFLAREKSEFLLFDLA